MDQKIIDQAKPYDGVPGPDWCLEGMAQNRWYTFRYYRTGDGEYYFTSQKRKKRRVRYDIRTDDQGRTFAKRNYKRPRFIKNDDD